MSKLQSVFLKLKSLKKRTYIIIGGCILAAVAAVLSIAFFLIHPMKSTSKVSVCPYPAYPISLNYLKMKQL